MSDIGVLVWDERQPRQQEAYDNFLGNAIAAHLRAQSGLAVRSAGLDDADQGLSDAALDASRVLVWWGHVRHRDVPAETGRRILDRVIAGRLSLIVLHSAHWATPFIAAMDHRTREDARRQFPANGGERIELETIVHKQTGANAALYGLSDRGVLEPGKRADISVIDFDRLSSEAPYLVYDLPENAKRYMQRPQGYDATICAGEVVLENDEVTGVLPGRLVRSRPAA